MKLSFKNHSFLVESPSTSVGTRMSKRIRLGGLSTDKKLLVLSKVNGGEADKTGNVEEIGGRLIDTVNDVELPKDDDDEEY